MFKVSKEIEKVLGRNGWAILITPVVGDDERASIDFIAETPEAEAKCLAVMTWLKTSGLDEFRESDDAEIVLGGGNVCLPLKSFLQTVETIQYLADLAKSPSLQHIYEQQLQSLASSMTQAEIEENVELSEIALERPEMKQYLREHPEAAREVEALRAEAEERKRSHSNLPGEEGPKH